MECNSLPMREEALLRSLVVWCLTGEKSNFKKSTSPARPENGVAWTDARLLAASVTNKAS
jgi:hypothetical protein